MSNIFEKMGCAAAQVTLIALINNLLTNARHMKVLMSFAIFLLLIITFSSCIASYALMQLASVPLTYTCPLGIMFFIVFPSVIFAIIDSKDKTNEVSSENESDSNQD